MAEAVAHVEATPLHAVTGEVPGMPGRMTTVHLSLSDATGDSAILEWIDGELTIHHDRAYQVMQHPGFRRRAHRDQKTPGCDKTP